MPTYKEQVGQIFTPILLMLLLLAPWETHRQAEIDNLRADLASHQVEASRTISDLEVDIGNLHYELSQEKKRADDLDEILSSYVIEPGYPKGTDMDFVAEVDAFVDKVCSYRGVDPELIKAVIYVESRYNPDSVSPAGCVGLMQVSPRWHSDRAEKLGVSDLTDVYGNIVVGVDYLCELIDNCSTQELALMSYNMGVRTARAVYNSRGPSTYATQVLAKADEFRERGDTNGEERG